MCATGQNQPMQNQTGLDGFAQAHFIRQQHARHKSARDFRSDVELVRNQINPATHESAHPGLAPAMPMSQSGHAEIEDFRRIELPGEQALLGFVKTDGVVQFGFAQLRPVAAIKNEPGAFDN